MGNLGVVDADMKTYLPYALLVLLGIVGCAIPKMATPVRIGSATPTSVSMIQLIAHPERYDGKRIHVEGFAELGWLRGGRLYLHAEDARVHLWRNGINLEIPVEIYDKREHFNGRYVRVSGTFRANMMGDIGMDDISVMLVRAEPDGTVVTNSSHILLEK